VADLFEGYPAESAATAAWDEVFESPGTPRPVYSALYDAIQPSSSTDLAVRKTALDRAFRDAGITFNLFGEERPFPLDLVPRLLSADEWDVIERGVTQRVHALEAFLADVYGRGDVLEDGVVPRRLVLTSACFHRAAHGVDPPNGVRVHVCGIDLVRDDQGGFRVLEDNVRVPSGVSYVIENRRAMARVFPELFATHRIRPVSDYATHLLHALRAAAPPDVADPIVVVLTPGVYNAAYFEHALLARQMGVELVEGRDLTVRNNHITMRTTSGEQPVHVVYRRLDDDWIDPLHFRPESVVGCAGLLNAARAGCVTIANAVGNGIADDKLMYTYVPELIRYYLGEEPILPNVDTYRLDEPDQRDYVLDRLDELVVKPVDGAGGIGIVIGPQASDAELADLRQKVLAAPRRWIAQPVVRLSTSPTLVGDRLGPRHVDLRPFAVNDGDRVWVLPGGLTRVALPRGSLVVNSSQGGGSKDTWVLAPELSVRERATIHARRPGAHPAVAPGPDPGPAASGEEQQQQQQQQRRQRQRRELPRGGAREVRRRGAGGC
jgi:uncharacterized circularly permuted ATP-grasp superfamily protein